MFENGHAEPVNHFITVKKLLSIKVIIIINISYILLYYNDFIMFNKILYVFGFNCSKVNKWFKIDSYTQCLTIKEFSISTLKKKTSFLAKCIDFHKNLKNFNFMCLSCKQV